MKYEKFRELMIDPFKVNYKRFELKEITGYPPAGNDVIEAVGFLDGVLKNVVIKFERSKMANFETEVKILGLLKEINVPEVYESGFHEDKYYIVLEKKEGNRLSEIFALGIDKESKDKYLIEYGKNLALIHKIDIKPFEDAKLRKINHIPSEEHYTFDDAITPYINYLKENKIDMEEKIFIHGDFHYANLLWDNFILTGILDLEYAGKGFKEQDIAWSCILRSSQKFMDTIEDIDLFLKGYLLEGDYDHLKLKWCLINGYCHFYLMNKSDVEYQNRLLKLLDNVIRR